MSSTAEPTKAIELFYSYAHKDEKLRNELEKHLSLLKRQGLISEWYDRDVNAGQEWSKEIDKHLNTAQMILFLVSPDFLASDYCFGIEVKQAIERRERGDALVIPIILRPTYWQDTPFGKFQALPKNARPVTLWKKRDEAFFEITEAIRKAIKEFDTKSLVSLSTSKQAQGIIEKPTFSYNVGFAQLHERLKDDPLYHSEVSILEARLMENMKESRLFGETELGRSQRAYIVSELNRLAIKALGVSFNDLCSSEGSVKSKRLVDLEDYLRESYLFIKGYEDIIRVSVDPREKARAQRSIETQWSFIRDNLTEYINLAKHLGVNVPTGINQIAAHFGDEEIKDENPTIRNALKTFSISELRLFCLDLGVDFDILPGEDVEAKAVALFDYMNLHSRMKELVEYLQRKRPSLSL
jgi:hypothetical protein